MLMAEWRQALAEERAESLEQSIESHDRRLVMAACIRRWATRWAEEAVIRSNRPPVPIDLRWRFAIHEAGHAVVHHALELGPVRGLNIDTGQGGYNLLGFHPSATDTREWYENMLAMLMAGRAAEALVLKRVSGGSGGTDDSDLARATRMAFDMERTLGFGTEYPLLYRPHHRPAEVLDGDSELAARIHDRLETAMNRATSILDERKASFHALIRALFDAQAMDEQAVLQILRNSDLADGS